MNLSNTFSFKLHALTYTIDMIANKVLQEHSDINFPQFLVILCFTQNPGETQKFASDWLQVTEPTISHMVNNISKLSYLLVKKDSKDARKKCIYPTEKGIKIINEIYPIFEATLTPHISVISNKRLQQMIEDMDSIKNSIKL